ncbi:hypothetical protein A1O1_03391 [Capronia coronata CBS 617.96]|uniref:Uncharacterized protein n=1 Tax=Capronia coronata CBS 617.96 TaxID=1182541 RepID=W9YBQ7_9EURO|nr:uncharacterized protein A1O1_03391 [Capronia coronata CBS 617.96]EXJ90292.1 hypothetical protein A1O1_03391 [Capronia coronata CBS 617.96]
MERQHYSRKLEAQLTEDIAALTTSWTSLVVEMATRLLGPNGFEDFDFTKGNNSEEEDAVFNKITDELVKKLMNIVLPGWRKQAELKEEKDKHGDADHNNDKKEDADNNNNNNNNNNNVNEGNGDENGGGNNKEAGARNVETSEL